MMVQSAEMQIFVVCCDVETICFCNLL